jgi:hypothetical protein
MWKVQRDGITLFQISHAVDNCENFSKRSCIWQHFGTIKVLQLSHTSNFHICGPMWKMCQSPFQNPSMWEYNVCTKIFHTFHVVQCFSLSVPIATYGTDLARWCRRCGHRGHKCVRCTITPSEEANVENYVLSHAYFTFHFIGKGLEHLTLQYPHPHHTLGKKSWSHGRGGHKMCEEVIHIPTLKTESEELSSHTLHPPKGHNT